MKSRYDWSKAPEWAKWRATDENGLCHWYENKPIAYGHCWRSKDILQLSYYGEPCPDWRNTLEQRPLPESTETLADMKEGQLSTQPSTEKGGDAHGPIRSGDLNAAPDVRPIGTAANPPKGISIPETQPRKEGDAGCPIQAQPKLPDLKRASNAAPATVQSPAAAASPVALRDHLEWAWGIIANASNGDWTKQSDEWNGAAIKWRDKYHDLISEVTQPDAKPDAETVDPGEGYQWLEFGEKITTTDEMAEPGIGFVSAPGAAIGCVNAHQYLFRRKLPAPPVQPKEEKREWTIAYGAHGKCYAKGPIPDAPVRAIEADPAEQTIAELEYKLSEYKGLVTSATASCEFRGNKIRSQAETIERLETQLEVEIQVREKALDSADERLGEITKQRQTIHDQEQAIAELKDKLKELTQRVENHKTNKDMLCAQVKELSLELQKVNLSRAKLDVIRAQIEFAYEFFCQSQGIEDAVFAALKIIRELTEESK
jgi:uncharacterized protein YoxC